MIEITNLSFEYRKHKTLFNNLNLSLTAGGICGLLGKNGSGKTTLLKAIAGLVFPTKGACQVMQQIPQKRQPSLLQDLYFLSENLFVPALIIANYVKCYASFYPNFDHALLQTYLQEFELPQDQLLTQFSYGQKKKFLIAFGLATGCRLFILDEPTNGLDIPSKAQFRKLLASAIHANKLFIISTHQVHDVENLIDSIVLLDEGKIILHQSMLNIANKLAFVQQTTQPESDACFYYEKHLGGYTKVIANKTDLDTHIDLEILFNAVLANKEKLSGYFNEGNV